MNQSESIQDRFGPAAAAYAASPVHRSGADLDAMLALGTDPEVHRVLDVACGAGHTALAFAERVPEVVALDLTPAMLAQAEALAGERGLANLTFQPGNAAALPFPDASFDVVTSRLAAHHYEDPAQAVREAARVLRPGGLFLLSDIVAPEDPTLDTFLNAFEVLRDASHVRDHRVGEWRRWFEAAGLDSEAHGPWSMAIGFDAWVARIGTPAGAVTGLRALFDHAPAPSRRAFGISEGYDFELTVAVVSGRASGVQAA
jgi:SAM-dependent methyltransferase